MTTSKTLDTHREAGSRFDRAILRRMARTPRDVRQVQAIRALVRAGGVERKAKGGHRMVKMPNSNTVPIPTGVIKPGTLEAIVRGAGLTMEEFVALL